MTAGVSPPRELKRKKYQRVIDARRLWAKGDGWWDITLACGHQLAVLHGPTSPLGESAKCAYVCGERTGDVAAWARPEAED